MILFIGNILSAHGTNPTAIEDLIQTFTKKYEVKYASERKNQLFRLIEMVTVVFTNKKKCDVIIIDVFSTKAFIFAAGIIMIAKIYNIPYIPVFRGGNLGERYRQYPKVFHFLFNGADTIICPSVYLKNYFQEFPFNMQIIPNYIDLGRYKFKERSSIKPKLLWVRSIHSIYNPAMAISVLGAVLKRYPEAQLCMVGPTKDDSIKVVQNMITSLKVKSKVTITGQMSKVEWIALARNYDIFINTTNIDNNPVSLLEAMALGLPIVSTNAGGIPYLIENKITGLLVKPKDVDAMVDSIFNLLDGKINGQIIARNARDKVSEFDKMNIIKFWDGILYSKV